MDLLDQFRLISRKARSSTPTLPAPTHVLAVEYYTRLLADSVADSRQSCQEILAGEGCGCRTIMTSDDKVSDKGLLPSAGFRYEKW